VTTISNELLSKRNLAVLEKALGSDHPLVGAALNNLAGLNEGQGRYGEAERLYHRSLAIVEKALGPDHPSVGIALNNLAGLYEGQGRYAEAEARSTAAALLLSRKRWDPTTPSDTLCLVAS
jgi:tetratricopeptide (TPR) repeat protein